MGVLCLTECHKEHHSLGRTLKLTLHVLYYKRILFLKESCNIQVLYTCTCISGTLNFFTNIGTKFSLILLSVQYLDLAQHTAPLPSGEVMGDGDSDPLLFKSIDNSQLH